MKSSRITRALSVRRWTGLIVGGAALSMVGLLAPWAFGAMSSASAAQSSVGLGTAESFAVLAGTTVTNTGPSLISGDLGVSPGSAITNFPPGLVFNGSQHAGDAVAAQAEADVTTAYGDAAGRTPATVLSSSDLGGLTLAPGVYKAPSSLFLTGTVTLDGENASDAVFIFQVASTLITASNSTVMLINGVDPCNVFWQVGSSATLGTHTTFVGNILALTDATVQTGSTVAGRVLARNGQVTLDSNSIIRPNCPTTTTTTTTTPTSTATSSTTTGSTTTHTSTGTTSAASTTTMQTSTGTTSAASTTMHASTGTTSSPSTTMHTSTGTTSSPSTTMHTSTGTTTAASTTMHTSTGTTTPVSTTMSSATSSSATVVATGTTSGANSGVGGASVGTPKTGGAVPVGLGLFLILAGTAGLIRGRRLR